MDEAPVVVVVDDEPVILNVLMSVLEGAGVQLHGFPLGAPARDFIAAHRVDVLVTDKNLPDVGGLQLIAAARAADQDTQCIVITGFPSIETAIEALHLEVYDYIVKPPEDIFEVRRKVEKAVERVRILRENRALVADLQAKNRDLERALSELRQAQGEVVQAEKLAGIGTLAAGVAHEVSSPLFGILGLAEAIQDEPDLSMAQGYATEIVSYSRAIKDIVRGLTRYSRRQTDVEEEVVDLRRAVEDATRLVVRSTGFPEQAVSVLGADAPVWVRARTTEVQQVFVNLIKNAIEAAESRHGPQGGVVQVRIRCDGGGVEVTVQDDGPGLSEAVAARVFDPFFTTKAPGRGTGLGLNIVYRIVTRARGTVSVRTAQDGGAVFAVSLPVVPGPGLAEAPR